MALHIDLGSSDESLLLSTHGHVGQLESQGSAGMQLAAAQAMTARATGIMGAAGRCSLTRDSFEAQATIQCRSAGVSLCSSST